MLKDRLKEIRKIHGVTQKEVADKLGMSDARYNQYETGKRTPDYDALLKIAEFFNVSTSYLLDDGLFKQRELIKELREPLTYALADLTSEEVAEFSKTLTDEQFLFGLSTIISKIDYNEETHEIIVHYYMYPEPSQEAVEVNNSTTQNKKKGIFALNSSELMFGEKINFLRKAKGLTMKGLGEQLGLSESTISLYEADKRTPDHETLLNIANYFGVSTSYFYDEDIFQSTTQDKKEGCFTFDASERNHIEKLRTLDDYGKKAVDMLLEHEFERCKQPAIQTSATPQQIEAAEKEEYTPKLLAAHDKNERADQTEAHIRDKERAIKKAREVKCKDV